MSGVGVEATGDRITRFLVLVATLFIAALIFAPASASAECTVHGSVYDWSTFEKVNNAIVDVYSMPGALPVNHMLVKGSYSFSLPKGDYMIVATSGTAGTPSEIAATENITVPESGERIIDLILFPPGSLGDLEGFDDTNATPTLPPDESPTTQPSPTVRPSEGLSALCLGGGAIVLAIAAIVAGLVLLRKLKPKPPAAVQPVERPPAPPVEKPPAPPAEVPPAEPQARTTVEPPAIPVKPPELPRKPSVQDMLLPDDCREVLAIMEKNGGRITQLDLRKALPYSEAKVSLIVSDLESRGLVKKIKKGRGNVLIMIRPGEKPPEGDQ